jgi:hypothetical protein
MLHYPEWKSDEKEKWISKVKLYIIRMFYQMLSKTLL